jgi:MFS family permease
MERVQVTETVQAGKASPLRKVLGNRNFRLLFLGQGTSLIGDQFYMIALPWLVLLMTGDAAQLGLVLALTGLPRVAFMLIGGALSDRFSQRSVMLVSDGLRLGLTALLAAIVLSGGAQVWMIYLFAVAFGAISGVFLPASQSLVPRIVGKEELMIGNTIEQIMVQSSAFVGPVLAGGVIVWFAGTAAPSTYGIGIAFAVDAFTFLASVVTLVMMRVGAPEAPEQKGILTAIGEGIGFVLKSRKIMLMFVVMSLINFLFTGPVLVGIPVLAKDRLPEGAAAYGLILAAFALGTLLGAVAAMAIKVRPERLGVVCAASVAIFGITLAALGLIGSTWEGMAVLLAAGVLNGYLGVVLITLLQKSTPPDLLGRLMSLVMLASAGLVPVSQVLAGFALKVSISWVFMGCGALIFLIAIGMALMKETREFGIELEAAGGRAGN